MEIVLTKGLFFVSASKDRLLICAIKENNDRVFTQLIVSRRAGKRMLKEFSKSGVLVSTEAIYLGKHSEYYRWSFYNKDLTHV